jgi:hypothetical protein
MVNGWMRVPKPPAMITAFMREPPGEAAVSRQLSALGMKFLYWLRADS